MAACTRPKSRYEHTVWQFMAYLRQSFPEARRPDQLRRDPHILGWLEHLWTRRVRYSGKPLAAVTRAAHLIRLRKLFDLLADHAFPPRPGLLLGEDIPRPDQVLPRPFRRGDPSWNYGSHRAASDASHLRHNHAARRCRPAGTDEIAGPSHGQYDSAVRRDHTAG